MEHAERAAVPEELAHVGGSAGAVRIVRVALVDPLLDLCGDFDALLAVDIGGAVLADGHDAVVLVEHLIVPVVPAAEDGAVALGAAVLVEEGGLLKERVHLVERFGHLDALGVGRGLVVVHDLRGDQVRQGDLLAVVAGGGDEALAEVLDVIIERVDVRIEHLAQAVLAVAGRIGGVAGHQRGDGAGAGGRRGDELGVDFAIAADVDGLDGDAHAVLGVELVHHVIEVLGELILMGVPPGDGDGFGDVVLRGGQRERGHQQEDGEQQGNELLHRCEPSFPCWDVVLWKRLRVPIRICIQCENLWQNLGYIVEYRGRVVKQFIQKFRINFCKSWIKSLAGHGQEATRQMRTMRAECVHSSVRVNPSGFPAGERFMDRFAMETGLSAGGIPDRAQTGCQNTENVYNGK